LSGTLKHPNILHAGSTALVVIDMQAPFVNSVFDSPITKAKVINLVNGCNLLKAPIIGTTQYAMRMGDIIPELRHLLPASPAHDKMDFDCCSSEPFLAAVAATGAGQILLCGVEAHICVCQTALGLLVRGYQVHVATDAVSSRSELDYKIGIDKMTTAGVINSSVEMALYELLKAAGSPVFKEVLAIIK
jgi:nicotinamidase-related amidase